MVEVLGRRGNEWAPEVHGTRPRPPFDEASDEVCELLALERDVSEDDPEGHVLTHRRTDRDALIASLTSGRSADWHRALITSAEARGWKRRRWRTLLTNDYLEELRRQITADLAKKTRAPAVPAEPWVLQPRRPPQRNP